MVILYVIMLCVDAFVKIYNIANNIERITFIKLNEVAMMHAKVSFSKLWAVNNWLILFVFTAYVVFQSSTGFVKLFLIVKSKLVSEFSLVSTVPFGMNSF